MSRHVPEFALVTGALLSLSFLVSSLVLTGDVLRSTLVAVFLGYPFVAYGVVHDDDPTNVLPPMAVLALGGLVGVVLLAEATLGGSRAATPLSGFTFGVLLGLLALLPPLVYYLRYGAAVNPLTPGKTALGCFVVAVGLLAVGFLADTVLYATADALLVSLTGALYAARRGALPSPSTRRLLVFGGVAAGVCLLAVGSALGVTLDEWVVVAAALTFGPSAYYALTVEYA
ncbi:hypothetical protein AUR64_05680 [Haloprofundus marisrubri]|uniref:Uncharacterized protein n=1 Tax=Haloprofundus marisrubri TaxID=1514971 RepID=A0A0W1RBA9_9EURY|nr:hypothetical protein [Haloprofundus marisrubri]KTG10688.1 hypothetical protein AUR64_05680 [Haloprofundus marisrubri]